MGQIKPFLPKKILIVDDNIPAAEALAALLGCIGHQTAVAYNGTEAISIAAQFIPQVVLLDIGMPGMSGLEVVPELRQIDGLQSTIIVALTGWGDHTMRNRAIEAGFDHHLAKPATLNILEQIIGGESASNLKY